MLLYDRVVEAGANLQRRLGRAGMDPGDAARLASLRRMPVYELTDVAGLFQSWPTEKAKSIPRRPPHDELWAEWRLTDADRWGRLWSWEIGLCVVAIPLDLALEVFKNDTAASLEGLAVKPGEIELAYVSQMYRRILKAPPKSDPEPACDYDVLHNMTGQVSIDPALHMWTMADQGRRVDALYLAKPDDMCLAGLGRFRLPIFGFQWDDNSRMYPDDPVMTPWPAFAAFSLLHCRNVVEEKVEPPADVQRRVQKAGNPPRVTYRVLKIEVPRDHAGRGSKLDMAGDGPKVRWHMVSGHFKNLRHARFERPGLYWWPAHCRGDKSLGEVRSRRELVAKGGGA